MVNVVERNISFSIRVSSLTAVRRNTSPDLARVFTCHSEQINDYWLLIILHGEARVRVGTNSAPESYTWGKSYV